MIFENINYAIWKPEIFQEDKQYPVVIFMHGAGGRGSDLMRLFSNPFFANENILLKKAIIYAPLCDHDTWFDIFESIRRFAHFVYNHKTTDINRVYLVGASMGGYAVWQMLMSDPHLYAGAIPICGGGMYWNAGRLQNSNIWAFHGRKDPIVLCEESIKMVENINKVGGSAKLTILDEYEHNVWNYVYHNPEPFHWLLTCKNASNPAISNNSNWEQGKYG